MKQFDFLSRKGRKQSPRKTLRQTFFFLAMLLGAFNSFGQTVLISPTVNNGGFESGTTGWTFAMETTSTTDANRWEVGGNSTPFAGTNAAYITTGAAGVPYSYNTAPAVKRTAHMYQDVTFPAAETNITFNFQWKARGESGWDRLLVYIAPTSVTPTSGVPASNSTTFTGATLLWTQPTFTAASGSTYNQANVTITAAQAGNTSSASTMRLFFVYQSDLSGGTNPPASVDNINLSTSCTGAAATTASSVTSSSATLNWTAFGGATGYNVRYKKVADPATAGTWATPTSVSGGSTVSLPVSSLTANTQYEYQVQATGPVCGVFSASSLFTTLCVSAPIPQNEGFNAAATIPTCWSTSIITTASTPPAITFETAGSNPTSAPSEGARMAMFNSFNSNGGVIRLASLPVSTTGVSSVEVQFDWLHDNSNYTTSGYAGEGVQVQYSLDGINWVNHGAFIPRISTGTSTYWETKRVVFPPVVGSVGTVFVGFLFTSKYGNNCFMDNIKIRKEVTCFPPTAVNVTAPSSSGFTVNWTAPAQGTPVNYRYAVSTTNTTPTGAGTSVAGTSVPVTGLNPNTTYYIFVRTNCGSDSSDWTTATSFTTPCATALLPQNQGFNAATTLPTCWSTSIITNSGTPPAITFVSSGSNPTSTPYEGANMAMFNSFNSNGGVIRLASLPVSTQCIPQAEVAFQWLHDNTNYTGSAYAGEGVQLQYSLNGTTWVDMGSFIPRNSTGTTAYWDPKTVQLPPAACNQATVYIGFRFTSQYGNNCYMDDIKIRQVQSCFPATAPVISSVKHNSATFAWTAPTSGTPAGYEYVVSTSSTTPTGSGTSVTSTSVNVIGLNPSTTYYAFVRTNCGGCDFSPWTGPVTFTTSCAPVTMPYTQQFGASLPTCWTATEATAGASQHWATTTADATNGAAGPKSGTHFARLNVNGAAATYNPYYMNLGPVTLLNCNNTIAYYYFIGNNGSTTPLSLEVSTSSTGPWTSLFAHTSANSTFATTNAVTNWFERIVDLNAYNGQTVYLRYASTSNAGTGIANQGIDSIRILPKRPTTTSASQCGAGTPTVSAASQTGVSSPSYRWYTVATGGTPLPSQSGPTLNSYPISTTTTFYVSEVVSSVESERTPVTATVTSVTTINTQPTAVTVCEGGNASFSCSAAGTGTLTYAWDSSPDNVNWSPLSNGGIFSGVNTNTLTLTGVALSNTGFFRCRATSNCGTTNSNGVPLQVNYQPDVTITASTNAVCNGQSISFTAYPTNAGTPSYQWRRNSTNVGTNNANFSTSTLANNDTIYCIITSTANCPPKTKDTSNRQVVTIYPLVPTSVTISSDFGTLGCVAVPVTFTATPVNPGANPTYQWKRNGSNVGSNSPIYKDSTMASGSIIRCEMASSVGCPNPANAVSNNITMTIIPVGYSTVSVKPSPDSIGCEGSTITFYSAFTNGGVKPRYQWMKNGMALPNDTLATYVTAALADNDQISVKFSSSESCVFPITSAPVTLQLDATVVPTATITGEPIGNGILFTAAITNGGTNPTLQWRKNNIDIPGATTTTFTASGLNLDDEISLWFVSDMMCAMPKAVSSNKLTPLKVTGINNISQQFSDMSLFPNPNTGEFNLRGTLLNAVNNKEAKIEIMNALGQVVYKTSSLVSGKELDIKVNMGGSQAAGMYMLHIDIDGNKNSLRFVLK